MSALCTLSLLSALIKYVVIFWLSERKESFSYANMGYQLTLKWLFRAHLMSNLLGLKEEPKDVLLDQQRVKDNTK